MDLEQKVEFHRGAVMNYGIGETHIEAPGLIRTGVVLYGRTVIGPHFHAGHNALVREFNVIGAHVSIGSGTCIEPGNKIGDHVRIHGNCFIVRSIIEDHVFIGPNVVFTDDPHPMCPDYKECSTGPIIRAHASIGAGSVILPGVMIGKGALVGAGSVVTKDVPDYEVWAGNPARFIRKVCNLKCHSKLRGRPYDWKTEEIRQSLQS